MNLSSLPFLIREAWLNVRRQALMTVASISTVAFSLSILGIFLFLAWQLTAVTTELPNQFEVHAFTRMETERAATQALTEEFRRLPGVEETRLVPREAEWERWRSQAPERPEIYGEENPFPDKIVVKAVDGERTLALAEEIRRHPEIDHVNAGEKVVRQALAVANVVRTGGLILALLLALGTAAIIGNAIRLTLYARRREIRIMQLVGATNGFIRLPFILEGVAAGMLGALLACGLLAAGVYYGQERLRIDLPLFQLLHLRVDLPIFFATLASLGILAGLLGSIVSLRRFLHA